MTHRIHARVLSIGLVLALLTLALWGFTAPANASTAAWIAQTSGTNENLRAVAAVNSTVAWAGGNAGVLLKTTDGSAWGAQTSGTGGIAIRGIAAVDSSTAWLVTELGGLLSAQVRHTSNGTDWHAETLSGLLGFNLHAIAAGSSAHLWAVGELGNIIGTLTGGLDLWPLQVSGTVQNLYAVSAADADIAWVAGNAGHVRRCDAGGVLPDTWDAVNTGGTENLRGVAALNYDTAWVVGEGGHIFKHTVSGWTEQTSGTTENLNGIWVLDANVAWAVGNNGTILKTTDGGAHWNAQTSGTTSNLNAIDALDQGTAWVVGDGGLILKTTTGGFTAYDVGASAPGGHGSVSPGSQQVIIGAGASISITPDATYHITRILDNGVSVPIAAPYMLSGVSADHTIVVSFGIASTSGFSPGQGPVNTTLTINGSGFGDNRGASYVTIGGIPVTDYISWSDTQIRVAVPAGASGNAEVVVVTTGNSSAAPTPFVVTAAAAPQVGGFSPDHGPVDTTLTITGSGFGDNQGGSTVTIGGIPVVDYISWSDGQIVVKVPAGVSGNAEVRVVTAGGSSTAPHQFVITPASGSQWLFAEGNTLPGFHEYLCLGNPNATEAPATVTYLFTDGTSQNQSVTIPAQSRVTVDVPAVVAPGVDVSIQVTSSAAIVAERPMYFNMFDITGGHDAVGATYPSHDWYFAEGCTREGFAEYICVLNPGATDASLTFRFQTEEQGEIVRTPYTVKAHSRQTFYVNDMLGAGFQTSLKLESTVPVVAERPMYFIYTGMGSHWWTGGHCVMGTPTLGSAYYFAEGTTRYNVGSTFEEWITLQNPNASPITVNAVYVLGQVQGDPVNKSYTVAAGKRLTVFVPNEVGYEKDVSVKLDSAAQFPAERPMYFHYQGWGASWTGGHCVIGAGNVSNQWFFAEGYTGQDFHEYLCLQNPGATDAQVTIDYFTKSQGALPARTLTVPASSRVTVFVNDNADAGLELSCRITSTGGPIVAERPMYFNFGGAWDGGHDVVGYNP